MLMLAGALPAPAEGTTDADVDPAATSPAPPPRATEGPAESSPADINPGRTNQDKGPPTCEADQACVDRYLWSIYERTPKIDTVGTPEKTKVTVKRKGKTTTVMKTVTKLADEDFAWKDPKAAELAGMAVMDYVIGGMDPAFRVTLYRALRALDDAGFRPGIMCAFRDDYRQSIATGLKAQNDRSYHGGSFRGGYGHGMAADIVSVRGDTRMDRLASSGQMWDYIDAHEKDLGIGRPYRDRDPPHVGPIDGQEYADHHPKPRTQHVAALKNKTKNATKNASQSANKNGTSSVSKDANRNAKGNAAIHNVQHVTKREAVPRPSREPSRPRTPSI